MRKTIITILGALLITGSTVQMATASEHHMRKAYRAPVSASEQFRRANNSTEGYTNGVLNDNSDFDRRNTFN
jgi:hypothetical protein